MKPKIEIVPPKLVLISKTEDGQDPLQFLNTVYESALKKENPIILSRSNSQRTIIIKKQVKKNDLKGMHTATTMNLTEKPNLHTELRRSHSSGFRPISYNVSPANNKWMMKTTSKIPIISMVEMRMSPVKKVSGFF